MNTIKTVKFPRGLLNRKVFKQKFDPISKIADSFAELEKHDFLVDSTHVNEKTICDWLLTNDNFKAAWDINNQRRIPEDNVVGMLWGARITQNSEIPDGLMEMRPEIKYINDVKPVNCCIGLDNLEFKFEKKVIEKPKRVRVRRSKYKNKGLRCVPPRKPFRGKSK